MVIVKLTGGLGNQLFQYAIGKNLSRIHKVEFKLDTTEFETYKLHSYSLNNFNIIENFATKAEIAKFKRYQRRNGRIWFLYNRLIADSSIYIQEKQFNFDPKILQNGNSVYLDGYWQTEKYFKDIENIIRKEFTLKNRLSEYSSRIANEILGNINSVSIHIRRGDYVSNENTNKHHGICSLEYYRAAINRLTESIEAPHFFIFSDDPKWTKENLILNFPTTYIDGNKADKNYEDLYLMSLCKHQIIANSSFSWWGAWLNINPNKIVIAPRQWFQTKKMDTRDLIPESWIKI